MERSLNMSGAMTILQAEFVDDYDMHDITELCRYTTISPKDLILLVEEGILDPQENTPPEKWRFSFRDLRRIAIMMRLQEDLGINLAGAAVIVDLLERKQK